MGKRFGVFTTTLLLAAAFLLAFPSTVIAQPLMLPPVLTVTFDEGKHGAFDENGAPAIQHIHYGDGASAPTVLPEKGYNFTGWDKEYGRITQDTTVSALYAIKTFTVKFNPGDHGTFEKGVKTVQTISYGRAAIEPEMIAEEGYDFTGWDKKCDHVTGNMTVTAEYKLKTFTVTFDPAEHGALSQNTTAGLVQEVSYGGTASAPNLTTDAGYIFTGWDGSFERITEDTTIRANYDMVQYTVSVRIQGSGKVEGVAGTYGYGAVIDLPASASAPGDGYTFERYEDISGKPISKLKVTEDTDIIALFAAAAPAETQQINEEQLPLAQNPVIKNLLASDYFYYIAGSLAILLLILFLILLTRRKKEENQPRYSYRFPIYRMLYRKKTDKK